MMQGLTRRRLLAGAACAASCAALRRAARGEDGAAPANGPRFRIITAAVAPADATVRTYDGMVPGPVLRATRGEEVKVRLVNRMAEPTAIHWHGVRLANPMDGVPGLTQAPIAPGESFDYRFIVPDAGTFWFHAPGSQLDQGLHGALIVDEPQPADVDREVLLVFHEAHPARQRATGSAAAPDPAGAEANTDRLAVNGRPRLEIPVRTNERIRFRLVNAAAARIVALRFDRHRAHVMAIDGEPAEPFEARDGRVVLGPGNRADLFVDARLESGEAASLLASSDGSETPIVQLVYGGAPARLAPRPDPIPLPDNALPARMDLGHAVRVAVGLGAIGETHGLAPANRQGKPPGSGLKRLSGIEDAALCTAKRGETVMLAFANRSGSPHSLHIHGHHFRLLDNLDDGWKPFWLDTLLLPDMQTARLAFVADNPGKWLVSDRGLGAAETTALGWFEVI